MPSKSLIYDKGTYPVPKAINTLIKKNNNNNNLWFEIITLQGQLLFIIKFSWTQNHGQKRGGYAQLPTI